MGRRARFLLLLLFCALPVAAQTEDGGRPVRQADETSAIQSLERKLDELLRQAEEIHQELQKLRPPSDDLTQVEEVQAPATAPAIETVQTIDNQVAPGASRALNPDMSVIGTFVGHGGDVNEFEARGPMELGEVELAIEAFIDPYAKGRFFIAVGPEEVELEEGYAQFIALPWDLTAKAGKTKATFGKANTWHTHTRPWVDQPLILTRFFGDEGLGDIGVSVSRPIANPFGAFIEATGEVYSGDVEEVFGRQADNDLFYNAHLKFFRDITENSNIEVGTSWARGTLPDAVGHNRFAGVDVTYRWKPLQRSIYNSFILRFEGLANRRADFDDTLRGHYLSADYQFARRWFTGVRFDSAERLFEDARARDRALSATLTFWPSEFSQVRGQFRRTRLGGGPSINEFLLQLQFAIGAHGAHVF
ncbi:MAG TPA: hypothetical protein VNA69_24765 [Thermoanaerobaculia bacterium]|nr:hypothetical protein [Thermoanaerobaculia bacterium]